MRRARQGRTIHDVARAAGVSSSTVSRVLNGNGRVEQSLVDRVLHAVQELGYKPSAAARSLRTGKTHTLGLVLPDITLPFFAEVIFSIEDVANAHGYSIILCNTMEHPEREARYLRLLHDRWVDGLIFSALADEARLLNLFQTAGIPLVQLDRIYSDLPISSVSIDHMAAGSTVVDYLVSLGHRRIAYLFGPATVRPFVERAAGYRASLRAHGIAVDETLVRQVPSFDTPLPVLAHATHPWPPLLSYSFRFYVAFGYTAASELLRLPAPPTAMFAANDAIALGAMKAIEEVGWSIPGDISLVGFDDVYFTALLKPALTTVAQPKYELGAMVVELLLNAIEHGDSRVEQRILPAPLVIRDSTAPPRPLATGHRPTTADQRRTENHPAGTRSRTDDEVTR